MPPSECWRHLTVRHPLLPGLPECVLQIDLGDQDGGAGATGAAPGRGAGAKAPASGAGAGKASGGDKAPALQPFFLKSKEVSVAVCMGPLWWCWEPARDPSLWRMMWMVPVLPLLGWVHAVRVWEVKSMCSHHGSRAAQPSESRWQV